MKVILTSYFYVKRVILYTLPCNNYFSLRIHMSASMDWPPFLKNTSHLIFGVYCEIFGEGNGTPLQYSRLENPMGGGAWWATVHGVPKSDDWATSLSLSKLFIYWGNDLVNLTNKMYNFMHVKVKKKSGNINHKEKSW